MNCPVPLYVVVCNIIKNDQNATSIIHSSGNEFYSGSHYIQ